MLDTILSGGTVYDGTGGASYVSDIGIKDGKIAVVGDLSEAQAAEHIDVTGLCVSPGFIDIHTHSDAILLADGCADSQVLQGVTSEVEGQCGFSFAPVGDPRRMEGWMTGRLPGVDVTWKSFGGYLDRLEQQDLGLNVMAMVGHGALRGAVLGDDNRQPSEDECAQMDALCAQSLDEGAWGLSTGLEYWPGLSASAAELTRLCEIVAKRDGFHASHVRNRDVHYDIGFTEVLSIGRAAGVRTQISHIQPKWGRPEGAMAHTLDMIDYARSQGLDVGFDIIPGAWSHTSVVAVLPSWIREGGVEATVARLKDPAIREKLKANRAPMWRIILDERWDLIHFLRAPDASIVGKTVAEVAAMRGTSPYDTVFDLLIEAGPEMNSMLWTSRSFFDEDLDMCVKRADCGIMSDSFALSLTGPTKDVIGSLAGYGWVARFLEHYVRDRKLISLEEGVRRLTSLPAERVGINDRGTLRVGSVADITVFDLEKVAYLCTIEEPRQHPTGFVHVYVNGKPAVSNGARTKVNAGDVLRRCA